MSDFLFPVKQTRRDFLAASAVTVTAWSLGSHAQAEQQPVTLGDGKLRFTLDESWGKLPAGMTYGFGCAVVADSKDRIFVTSRTTNPCVAIFDADGKLLETWNKQFTENVDFTPEQYAATAHGLYISKEGNDEFMYWTENVAGKGGDKIGARMYKTDMDGKVLYTLGNVEKESDTAQKVDFVNPTDVAVAPNGDLYVVDGYGSQRVYRFDKDFKHLKTIGQSGTKHGEFRTCHGVWINTLKEEPEVYIADRANNRVEVYDLELEYKRTIPGFRMPCCFYQHEGLLYIPELGARVTIIDDQDKVVGHYGDGSAVKKEEIGQHPDKFATPHALTVDSKGNLYVIEWLPDARVRKFVRG